MNDYEKQRYQANLVVQKAYRAGLLIPADTCELCGRSNRIVAHHWNGYINPLDIWWLCGRCNTLLPGEQFHNGTITKEQALMVVLSYGELPA